MTAAQVSVTHESVLLRSDEVLYQEVGDEAVLLDLSSEQYFGLDPVGTRIWNLLDGESRLEDIHATLADEYDADPAQIGDDLQSLAQALADAGLVRVTE
jgi:hypothetical protein